MTISRALAGAALLGLAVAGCSSGSDEPAAAGTSAAAAPPAGSSAAAPGSADPTSDGSGSEGSGDCSAAPAAAKAAMAGMDVTDVQLLSGCTALWVKTPTTDPAIGRDMCTKVAGEVYQLGVKSIAVESDAGDALAVGSPAQPCTTP
jgi:hypothetical protein